MNDRDVTFLYEVGSLRHVKRMWTQFGGLPTANVSEHSFRVAWISYILAIREGADIGRCFELALLHDLPETRTGDVNYLQRIHTVRNEQSALDDATIDTSLQERAADAWLEWERRETLEARLVADADALDCDLELRELEEVGAKLPRKLRPTRDVVRGKLHTESARSLFDRIRDSDPNDWHLSSRNRLTVGDWSK